MELIDHTGHLLTVNSIPQRIISLVPSITETLFEFGLNKRVAAITDYCIAPEGKVAKKPSVGGTKEFDFFLINQLNPDLIIGEKEENYPGGIVALRKHYPVWTGHINSINRALDMIDTIGKMVDRQKAAGELHNRIKRSINAVTLKQSYKAAYLIWKDPYIAAGGDTFIDNMLSCCGMVNVFKKNRGYPRIKPQNLEQADLILLASEPYAFTEQDGCGLREYIPGKPILLVDGTMFAWYGYRMAASGAYFTKLQNILAEKSPTSEILYV